MHFYMNAHMSCQCPEPSLTPSHMHMPCMKNLYLKTKYFCFIIQLHWTTSDKLLYSKTKCFLWATTFRGLTAGVMSLPTFSRAFTAGYICLTKDVGLLPEGVSITSCYYPTHNFNHTALGLVPLIEPTIKH